MPPLGVVVLAAYGAVSVPGWVVVYALCRAAQKAEALRQNEEDQC